MERARRTPLLWGFDLFQEKEKHREAGQHQEREEKQTLLLWAFDLFPALWVWAQRLQLLRPWEAG